MKSILEIKQANINFLLPQIKTALSNSFPKIIIRTDITSYYESIPQNEILDKIWNDSRLSLQTKKVIKNILTIFGEKFSDNNKGLPRGIGISAYLSEYYMKDFDNHIKSYPECSYYARYVDDILIIFNPNPNSEKIDYQNYVSSILKEKFLSINPQKTEFIDQDNTKGNGKFEFLGYDFTISNGKLESVLIRKSRINLYKERIKACFLSYARQTKNSPKKATLLLRKRLRILTSNTRLVHNKNNVLTGIYFSNKFITDTKQLKLLDDFIKHLIKEKIDDPRLQLDLQCYSYEKGFTEKRFIKFSMKKIKKIQSVWKYIL